MLSSRTIRDIANIAAVEHMGDVGHRNNDEAAGVGCQCRLDPLLNGAAAKCRLYIFYATRLGKRAFSLSRKISANFSKPALAG
jgi:hypothetical protein